MATDIPAAVRAQVIERDGSCCRVCGQHQAHPHLHHITYRSQGGQHEASNLISLCYRCHMERAHGANNRLWREIFGQLIEMPGVSGLALRRWQIASR